MKKIGIAVTSTIGMAILISLVSFSSAWSHCEVPCGIYDDGLRAQSIAEDITTIEKAMDQIKALGKEKNVNYNQLVRWITTKETHADKIQHTVSQYFLTQRIKPDAPKYEAKLKVLHKMLLSAMKCKQTTLQTHVDALRKQLEEFKTLYFTDDHAH